MTEETISENLKPRRVRFAPTPPPEGGPFLHIGHVAMLLMTREIAVQENAALDIRFDAAPDAAGLLDVWNCLNWLGVLPSRVYVLTMVNETQIINFGNGDASRFSRTQLSAHFDDLRVENNTLITRDNEFSIGLTRQTYDALDVFWGRTRKETNFPNMLRGGRKMSKSDNNALHWSVLKDFDVSRVKEFMLRKMLAGENWNWDWKEFVCLIS